MKQFILALLCVSAISIPALADTGDSQMSQGAYIGGGIAGTIVGFGTGHMIQGRFMENGWIFAAGQGVGALAAALGFWVVPGLPGTILWWAGASVFTGFWVWNTVDVWLEPVLDNRLINASYQNAMLNVPASQASSLGGPVSGLAFQW